LEPFGADGEGRPRLARFGLAIEGVGLAGVDEVQPVGPSPHGGRRVESGAAEDRTEVDGGPAAGDVLGGPLLGADLRGRCAAGVDHAEPEAVVEGPFDFVAVVAQVIPRAVVDGCGADGVADLVQGEFTPGQEMPELDAGGEGGVEPGGGGGGELLALVFE